MSKNHDYDDEQINKISRVQQVFKKRKMIIDFDYYVKETRFNFQVYWLQTKRLLLFKIFIFGESSPQANQETEVYKGAWPQSRIPYVNLNDQTMMDNLYGGPVYQGRNELIAGSYQRNLLRQNSMMMDEPDKTMIEPPRDLYTQQRILFQNLKVSMEEILPDFREDTQNFHVKK